MAIESYKPTPYGTSAAIDRKILKVMNKFFRMLSVILTTLVFLSLPASAGNIVSIVRLSVTPPQVGAKPDYKPTLPPNASTKVSKTVWKGYFSDDLMVIQGNDYTIVVNVAIREGLEKKFTGISKITATVNGEPARVVRGSNKEIIVEYTWKTVGGEPDTPEYRLKKQLKELSDEFPASNATEKEDIIDYLKRSLPAGSSVWPSYGASQFGKMRASYTKAGSVKLGVGVTVKGVTVEGYRFSSLIPALQDVPGGRELYEDKAAMQDILKNFICTAKTTKEELLRAVSSAATGGTKVKWNDEAVYKAPTAKDHGEIKGDLLLSNGEVKDNIKGILKILPIAGDKTDAKLDMDIILASRAVDAMQVLNSTTEEDVLKVARGSVRNGTEVTCASFTKTEAELFGKDGKLVAWLKLSLRGKERELRCCNTIPSISRSLPSDNISVNQAEWDVLRIVNIERYRNHEYPLSMTAGLQNAMDIRAEELTKFYSHTRPDGQLCFSVLDNSFRKNRKLGENIAMCQQTPEAVMDAWMNSSGHRANILNPQFAYIGVGFINAGRNHWGQMFAAAGAILSARSSTGSLEFPDIESMLRAYLILENSEGIESYMPIDTKYMTRDGNTYTLRLNSAVSVTLIVTE